MKALHFESIKALILDMDGVIWRGDTPIGDLPAIFGELQQRRLLVALATNNSTLSTTQFLEKIRQFGVSLEDWQIVNSAQATAHYLRRRYPIGGSVFIVGETGLIQTLAEAGYRQGEKNVLAVVAGLDRELTYASLCKAAMLIRSGAEFIGTNPDRTLPTNEGLIPGAGSVLAFLESATDVKPTIVGKPAPEMYRLAMERLGATPEQTLVVGDRLETDIAGAQELGCRSALVLSGATSEKDYAQRKSISAPDLVVQDLTNLLDYL